MTADPAACARLYETLARWQWWRRRWQRCAPGYGLELRKRLRRSAGDGPADGGAGFDSWLRGLANTRDGARVLDVGCGFGISLLRWLEAGAQSGVGVTSSAFQAGIAAAEAGRQGLGERAVFRVQDFTAPFGGPFDVVLAIEALGHAADLRAVVANVVTSLVPGGKFVWVEDLLREPLPGDEDVAELARRWSSPALRTVAEVRAALAAAGLTIVLEADLSAQVDAASLQELQRRGRALACWRALLPLAVVRRLADAFLGGLSLERLYARGAARYRVVVAAAGASR